MRRALLAATTLFLAAGCGRGSPGENGPQGPQGPAGDDPSSAPRIDSVSPAIASKRNTILVTGTSFSANASELEVRIGGIIASVVEATPTSIRVVPPPDLEIGPAPLVVTRGAKSSASVALTFVESGVTFSMPSPLTRAPGEAIELSNGKLLVADRDDAAILEIATDGVVRTLVKGNGLASPRRLLLRPDGKVLVFDAVAPAIFRLDPATGDLDVQHFGEPYVAGSLDAAGNLYALPLTTTGFDRFDANGTKSEEWGTYPLSVEGRDVQVVGNEVFVAVEGANTGVLEYDVSTGGAGAPLVVTGINAIRALAPATGGVYATGDFGATNGEGIAQIDGTTGAITPVTADATPFVSLDGALPLQNGDFIVSDVAGRWVARLAGTTLSVLAGIGDGIDHLHPAGASTWAVVENGAGRPGWIVALAADGTSRVVARGRFGQIAAAPDAAKALVTRLDLDDVAEIDLATGVAVSAIDVSAEMQEPVGYARDSAGYQYVSSAADGVVRQYDSSGNVMAGWAVAESGAAHLRVDGAYLWIASPTTGSVKRAYLLDASVAVVFDASAGVAAPTASFRDTGAPGDSYLYVTDPVGGWIYRIDGDAHGSVGPFLPLDASALLQREDGMLVGAGGFGLRLITP